MKDIAKTRPDTKRYWTRSHGILAVMMGGFILYQNRGLLIH